MLQNKKEHPKVKPELHPGNKNREHYDFGKLIGNSPELAQYFRPNIYGDESVDFANPEAVKALNKSLLIQHYGITKWDIPPGYLCPPVTGRADIGCGTCGPWVIANGSIQHLLPFSVNVQALQPSLKFCQNHSHGFRSFTRTKHLLM
jgi:hypothetical protein